MYREDVVRVPLAILPWDPLGLKGLITDTQDCIVMTSQQPPELRFLSFVEEPQPKTPNILSQEVNGIDNLDP